MEYPVDGCDCSLCEWARYWAALTPAQQREELDAMATYVSERERDK